MDMKSIVLKTIKENTAQDGTVFGIWVIGYYDGPKSLSVKVVAGKKKKKENGDIWYVAAGFAPRDFDALKPFYQEFLALSKNPPPLPNQEPVDSDAIEEIPF